MERKYKPLRPAYASPTQDSDQDTPGDPTLPQKRKRVQVKVACDSCRIKKSACDGQRPVCAACVRRGSSCTFGGRPAEYSDSSSSQTPLSGENDRLADATELLSLLAAASDDVALELLTQIKFHRDFSLSLAQAKRTGVAGAGYPGTEPISPPDQNGIEFELMTRHPILYPAEAPLDGKLDPTRRCIQTKTSGDSLTGLSGIDSSVGDPKKHDLPEQDPQSEDRSQILPELAQIDFPRWTKVPIATSEGATVLSKYFELDHPILGLFDKELFLNDFCHYSTRYCSELLVNAVMSWACLSSSLTNSSDSDLSTRFFTEAVGLWDTGQEPDSLATLPAIQFLSLTATYLGRGEKGLQFLRQAISMGKRMDLIGHEQLSTSDDSDGNEDMRAASHCAWGLFAFATLHSLHCQQGELEPVPPPLLPLSAISSSMHETEATIPTAPRPIPVFSFFCRLWDPVHDIVRRYYASDKLPKANRFDAVFVGPMLHRLLSLGDHLPLRLARGNKLTHHGVILHIMFHAAIISLLRPLVLENNENALGLDASADKPAESISIASVKQMKRLITIYQSNFRDGSHTVLWHTACLVLANSAVRSPETIRRRLPDFYLALSGYQSLYPRYPVVIAIVKGMLAMAVSSDLIATQDAYKVIQKLRSKEMGPRFVEEPTEACFMIDLDLAVTDLEGAHIDSLAQRFDDLVLFDEFTHHQVDEDGGVKIS